jgi:hypothetical protein
MDSSRASLFPIVLIDAELDSIGCLPRGISRARGAAARESSHEMARVLVAKRLTVVNVTREAEGACRSGHVGPG